MRNKLYSMWYTHAPVRVLAMPAVLLLGKRRALATSVNAVRLCWVSSVAIGVLLGAEAAAARAHSERSSGMGASVPDGHHWGLGIGLHTGFASAFSRPCRRFLCQAASFGVELHAQMPLLPLLFEFRWDEHHFASWSADPPASAESAASVNARGTGVRALASWTLSSSHVHPYLALGGGVQWLFFDGDRFLEVGVPQENAKGSAAVGFVGTEAGLRVRLLPHLVMKLRISLDLFPSWPALDAHSGPSPQAADVALVLTPAIAFGVTTRGRTAR